MTDFTHKVGTLAGGALKALGAVQGVVSGAASIAAFFGRDAAEWDVMEATFHNPNFENLVVFHIFESKAEGNYKGALSKIQDSGGRRKIKIIYPYVDGQSTDDLGRVGETFDLDCVFFGHDYKTLMSNLFDQLQDPVPGVLFHPIRGQVTCALERHEIIHDNAQRQSASVKLTLIEHSFDPGFNVLSTLNTLPSALSALFKAFQNMSLLLTKLSAIVLFSRGLTLKISQLVQDYQNQYVNAAASINRVFNKTGQADFPGLLPVNQGGLTLSNATSTSTAQSAANANLVISDRYRTGISPDDPFATVPVALLDNTTVQALAALQVAKQVNASRVAVDSIINALKQLAPVLSGTQLASSSGLKLDANGNLIFSGVDDAGALEFQDEILNLKQSAIDLQTALEVGIASSKTRIVTYTTPRTMTIREVAFANNVSLDRVVDIDLLNPALESVNFIAEGTAVKVPVS